MIFLAKTPFLRLLIPLVVGIILQWYLPLPIATPIAIIVFSFIAIVIFFFVPIFARFKYSWLRGVFWNVLFISVGMLLVFTNDIRHYNNWFGNYYRQGSSRIASLTEQPVEKQNSYKAEANITTVVNESGKIKTAGKIVIYFKKDSAIAQLRAGNQLVFQKPLQEIKNNGNPGGFDYKRYSLFNDITHQVYLNEKDFILLKGRDIGWLQNFLSITRNYVLNTLKNNITGPKEIGLAEALLIGYKDDLDKNLLQSYTNTGVVHIIAVSGMHLTLLFWILNIIFNPLLRSKKTKWLHPMFVLLILWLFSLLTGGAASIIRAAVMFSFILIGKMAGRNASVYNTLAASAFFLLCYNPFWIWDVGFQLSYAAVLSIVIFFKPIYHLLFFKNRSLDWFWQLIAVSISAQILTTPFSMYHFHQFPIYFLITNLVAVPVSSFILVGELVLIILSPVKILAHAAGYILSGFIWWLNSFIESIEQFPFALWEGLQITIIQAILLFIIVASIAVWLSLKNKPAFWIALGCLLLFFAIRYQSFYTASQQQKIIVYNVPKNTAIDFIQGRKYFFYGDSDLLKDDFLRNFHLKPSRVLQRLVVSDSMPGLYQNGNVLIFQNIKIMLFKDSDALQNVNILNPDLFILTGNTNFRVSDLPATVKPALIIIDGSVPFWKANRWQKEFDSLHLPCYNISEKGAFVMNLR
jgi:competence protein ComEC